MSKQTNELEEFIPSRVVEDWISNLSKVEARTSSKYVQELGISEKQWFKEWYMDMINKLSVRISNDVQRLLFMEDKNDDFKDFDTGDEEKEIIYMLKREVASGNIFNEYVQKIYKRVLFLDFFTDIKYFVNCLKLDYQTGKIFAMNPENNHSFDYTGISVYKYEDIPSTLDDLFSEIFESMYHHWNNIEFYEYLPINKTMTRILLTGAKITEKSLISEFQGYYYKSSYPEYPDS